MLCPVLAFVLPPEGDIPGFWDCPPYGSDGGASGESGGVFRLT